MAVSPTNYRSRAAHAKVEAGKPVEREAARWRVGVGNARTAIPKGDQSYIAGCAFRSLACAAQVLFALNRRYLINEKGAVAAAARLPLTIADLTEQAQSVLRAIGLRAFDAALSELMSLERELAGLAESAR